MPLVGAISSLAAGASMAAVLMAIGEIASEPTAVPGIDSSTWTALTSIASFVVGLDAFHGSFHVLPILLGLAVHMGVSVCLGIACTFSLVVVQGMRPGPAGAALQGLACGLFAQVAFLNVVVNAVQDVPSVYESIPRWGWWVAHAAYGVALGLVASALFRLRRTG